MSTNLDDHDVAFSIFYDILGSRSREESLHGAKASTAEDDGVDVVVFHSLADENTSGILSSFHHGVLDLEQ